MRASLAVFAGYLIFAGSAALLFRLTKVDPHSPAAVGFELLTIVYGVAFALLGGFVTGKIAQSTDLNCGIALALLIALGATVSMICSPRRGGAVDPNRCVALVCAGIACRRLDPPTMTMRGLPPSFRTAIQQKRLPLVGG